jgi:ATP-dependent helicase HepA
MENNISGLLYNTSIILSSYLEKILPELFNDWWSEGVLSAISHQQRQRIEQKGLKSLSSLDLAALLRVLDQNWYNISRKMNLASDARHFVKEMQTVRNRWSHLETNGLPADDVYRDLDTLQRFAKVIEADDAFVQQISTTKKDLLYSEKVSTVQCKAEGKQSVPIEITAKEFKPGQIVFLKSNPLNRGAILSVLPGESEDRYNVFVNGEKQTFYVSQLQAEEHNENDSLLSCQKFHSYLTAIQIRHPVLSTLYSLNAARIDHIPYQFRPVLQFIRSDRERLLIADGVGVGKTIEAGLILRELQARSEVRSVLIICPRPLVIERKWEIEMKRFEERFTHVDGKLLKLCISEMDREGEWPEQYEKIIVPFSLFDEALLHGTDHESKPKRKKGLLSLDPPPRFDLVIVDEAHHIRNPETYKHKVVRFFCDNAQAVVFLTATPIQMGNHDLFVLLNTLRPDLIIDKKSFEHMAEPNPFINRAVSLARTQESGWEAQAVKALDEAAATSWGKAILHDSPEFNRVRNHLAQGDIVAEERIQLITDIESLHTFAGIINRTRRRDISAFTKRKPETVNVEFSPEQKKIHDDLLQVQAEIFSHIHGDVNVMFMMTTIRRQAASCLFGLVPFLQEILSRHLDELAWDEADNNQGVPLANTVGAIESKIKMILEQVRNLSPGDPKLEQLKKILNDKQELLNNKVMIFSSFRHTLQYLYKHLKDEGFRVGLVHGGTSDEERVRFRNLFELSREQNNALDILLFSEVGCEGLDYQFCDCIVNYDLPWNPMRIEQRIGRIDRWGQKSESVAIFNIITPGTVDADIYERCLLRIGVFTSALGGTEEILGEISSEIRSIAENFSLSDKERSEKLQQLSDNKIRFIQEQETLEEKEVELFGIRLTEDHFNKEISDASNFWLSQISIYNLVSTYLQKKCGENQEFILGDKLQKKLRLSQEARNSLLYDFKKLSRQTRQNLSGYREWENWLKGGEPHLSITFDSDCACRHPEVSFIMPLHPLVKQASEALDLGNRVVTALKVREDSLPHGNYQFAIYQWRFHGIKEDLILCPVSTSEAITPHMNKLLEKAVEDTSGKDNIPDSSCLDKLDTNHHKLWSKAIEEHKLRIQEQVMYRRESLTTSHHARISRLSEQLKQANDDKIKRMRQSQISTEESDYARRIQDLDIAVERADVTAQLIAYGVIKIEEI